MGVNAQTPMMRLGSKSQVVSDPNMLGQIAEFQDQDHDNPEAPVVLSNVPVRAVLVQNDSGGTLASGLGATYKAGHTGKKVGALSGANAICHGIVDPWLGTGVTVANGHYFWLVINGPCDVEVGAGDVTAGGVLQTLANGKFTDATPGTNPIGHSGQAVEAAASGARARAFFHNPFAPVQ